MSGECDEALANLYSYLDAEMDGVSTDRIRAHLSECGGCGRPFDFERRLRDVIRARLDEEVPESIIVRIRAVLAVEHGPGIT